MQVRVLFFGVLRDLVERAERSLEMKAGATAGDVVEICRVGAEGGIWGSLAVAVNQEYAGRDRVLAEGDEVALLPPVSGGASERQGVSPGGSDRAARRGWGMRFGGGSRLISGWLLG